MTTAAPSPKKLNETTSLCRVCKKVVPAEHWVRDGAVFLEKVCPEHGAQQAMICSDADWYADTMQQPAMLQPPQGNVRPVDQGCPYDCGSCAQHEQRMHLPVVPITSACGLDCPICYTHNKNDDAYHMPVDELDRILAHIEVMAPDKRIINITGGEPTDHPQLLELVRRCTERGIQRVTISTHGLGLHLNTELLEGLAALDGRIILSFDSFRDENNKNMLGGAFTSGKMKTLEALEQYDITTTLIPVLCRGENDDEVADFIDFAFSRPFIQSVEFHPMTFTGQSGASFGRGARYTPIDALRDLEHYSQGRFVVDDFVPSPIAHPLCYQVTYVLRLDDGSWIPFPRFMARTDLRKLLGSGLYLEPTPDVEATLADVINRLWAGDIEHARADDILSTLKRVVGDLFDRDLTPRERLKRAERTTKAVYIHTHMDEETFDTDRIRQCCVSMPDQDGQTIPSCAYNILYRERDARFAATPESALITLGRGHLPAQK